MRIVQLLKSADQAATRLTIGALALLVVKGLVLNRFEARFLAIYDLGVVAEAILASVVASYIFYLFVVHLKEASDKMTLAPYLDRHTLRVVGDCKSQLAEISRVSGLPLDLETLTSANLTQALSAIPPYSNAPLILAPTNTHANWFQYFEYHRIRTKESIARVFTQMAYLDAKRVGLLAAVDDCTHFGFIPQVLHTRANNPHMGPFASMFYRYCQHCLELQSYMAAQQVRAA